MAAAAVDGGIRALAATPHLRGDFPEVRVEELGERCARLREQLMAAAIPLEVFAGAEVSLFWALDARPEQLCLATYGQRGSDMLLETPSDGFMLERMLAPLLERGLRITLAHPERCRTFQRDPRRLAALAERGVLAQVNAQSLLAPRRSAVRGCAERLCRDGLAHALASDGHQRGGTRPVEILAAAVDAAARVIGRERARWLAADAPAAIVEGRSLPPAPEVRRPQSSGRWFTRPR
jgi:protein-tyrosine phosphatase